jgi:predicted O-methyltransferase YrrM
MLTLMRDNAVETLVVHLQESIEQAERLGSNLARDGGPVSHHVGGFCGLKCRHLWNNLGRQDGLRLLEIGTLHGASLLSACYGNRIEAVAVDDWAWPGCDSEALARNIKQFSGESTVTLHTGDCWTVPLGSLGGPFDVLYYDAAHDARSTERAFSHFLPVMKDPFLMVVDDASWDCVREGIREGKARLFVHYERTLHGDKPGDEVGWWNDVAVLVLGKQP